MSRCPSCGAFPGYDHHPNCAVLTRKSRKVDHTGDIAIPDEVVDLRLLLECRRERDEARAEVERLREERDAAQWYPLQGDMRVEVERYRELKAEVERLRTLLHRAAPFIRLVMHSTEARYDDPQSEYYDDGAQYEIIRECSEILDMAKAAIDAAREGE